jgi:hypothetical protein
MKHIQPVAVPIQRYECRLAGEANLHAALFIGYTSCAQVIAIQDCFLLGVKLDFYKRVGVETRCRCVIASGDSSVYHV